MLHRCVLPVSFNHFHPISSLKETLLVESSGMISATSAPAQSWKGVTAVPSSSMGSLNSGWQSQPRQVQLHDQQVGSTAICAFSSKRVNMAAQLFWLGNQRGLFALHTSNSYKRVKLIGQAGWNPGLFTVYRVIHNEEKSSGKMCVRWWGLVKSKERTYISASLNIHKSILLTGWIV